MPETKKETILIPRTPQPGTKENSSSKGKGLQGFYFSIIFLLYIGLLVLVAFLPINLALKILALVIGSFILEDLNHSFKSICQQNLHQL